MFVQIIRAKVSDRQAAEAAAARWVEDLGPGAKGWVGGTSGVTDDGELFVMAQFDSEGSARANSARPEQDKWWAEFSKSLDGAATFQDSNNVFVETTGDLSQAGFVQVIIGKTKDLNRSRELMTESAPMRAAGRPDILGTISVGHQDGKFSSLLYFTSETEAREGESKERPPEAQQFMDEMMSLGVEPPEYLDINKPRIHRPS